MVRQCIMESSETAFIITGYAYKSKSQSNYYLHDNATKKRDATSSSSSVDEKKQVSHNPN